MRAHAPAYPLWKRGNEMDQTIAFLGGDARMRLLAQMMAAEGGRHLLVGADRCAE